MVLLTKEIDEAYVKALLKEKKNSKKEVRRRALVMVLGDIGHSPRMQYHVASLAKEGFDVDFLGYRHSEPRSEIQQKPAIEFHTLRDIPKVFSKLPRLAYLPFKVIWLMVSLFYSMSKMKKPDVILIQNPPTIPIVLCAFLLNYFWQAALILDWHNYSYSIFALNMKKGGLVRRFMLHFMEYCEANAARLSDGNICVTHAMADDMKKNWDAKAVALYDRPPGDFGPCENMEAKHYLFMKIGGFSSAFRCLDGASGGTQTVFTKKDPGQAAAMKEDRPALLVSSTSWTEDEDFGILFDALKLYDSEDDEKGRKLPKLVVVVTGKGPLKQFYMDRVKQENLQNVSITSCWLETADYPRLLGSADLGICLHYSSSGLDLPMKVVDMFGCGLPVCAVRYKCIEELVKPNSNGLLFTTPEELCQQLCGLLAGFPRTSSPQLAELRDNVQTFRRSTWHENWKTKFHPVVLHCIETRKKYKVDTKKRVGALCAVVAILAVFVAFCLNVFTDILHGELS